MAAMVSAQTPVPRIRSPNAGAVSVPAAQVPDPVEHLLLPVGEVFVEPSLEEVLHAVGQPQHDEVCVLCAGLRGLAEDRCDLVVGEPGHDGGDADAGGNAPVAETGDRLEAPLGRGGARLHRAAHVLIQRGHREGDADAAVGRQLGQDVAVAGDECALGDDADGVAELGEHFQAPARELKPTLDRLIRIGHSAHREQPGLPGSARQLGPQQLRGARLDEDARLEIEPGGQARGTRGWAARSNRCSRARSRGRD